VRRLLDPQSSGSALSGGRDAAIVPGSKQTGSGKPEPALWPLVICVAAALLCFAVEIAYVLL
jgi:hypothetical protein